MGLEIRVCAADDLVVGSAKEVVRAASMVSWVLLFEGERWCHIERVVVALVDDEIVGLASLSQQDAASNDIPEIVGVWVRPEYRRQGIGTKLVNALSEEAQRLYQEAPRIVGVSTAGAALARYVARHGVNVDVIDIGITSNVLD